MMPQEIPAAESSPQPASGPAGGPASTLSAASFLWGGPVSTEFPLLPQPVTTSVAKIEAQIPRIRCLRTMILLSTAYSQ